MARVATLHHVAGPAPASQLVVLTCVVDPLLRARLQDAVRDRGAVHIVGTLGQMLAALRSSQSPADIVVVPPRDAASREAASVVREIVADFPHVAIIAYCRAGIEH